MVEERVASEQAHRRVVARVSRIFLVSIVAQAAAFLLPAWAYHYGAAKLIEAVAASKDAPPVGVTVGVLLAVILLDLFLALLVGFFGARRLIRDLRRATPPSMKPPVAPVPFATLVAAVLVVTALLAAFASQPHAGSAAGWVFQLLRVLAIGALLYYAAVRAVRPRRTA